MDQLRARIHEPTPGRAAARGEGCALIAGSSVREPISAAAAGRIACDAALIPAVLGGPSQLLDLGRAVRTATAAQPRALALRDRGCTAPGCDRPPEWCQAHHIIPWSQGGTTDLNTLTLACDRTTTWPTTTDGPSPSTPPTASAGTHHPNPPEPPW